MNEALHYQRHVQMRGEVLAQNPQYQWKIRTCEIRESFLSLFRKEKIVACFDLRQVGKIKVKQEKAETSDKGSVLFIKFNDKRLFSFRVATNEDAVSWVQILIEARDRISLSNSSLAESEYSKRQIYLAYGQCLPSYEFSKNTELSPSPIQFQMDINSLFEEEILTHFNSAPEMTELLVPETFTGQCSLRERTHSYHHEQEQLDLTPHTSSSAAAMTAIVNITTAEKLKQLQTWLTEGSLATTVVDTIANINENSDNVSLVMQSFSTISTATMVLPSTMEKSSNDTLRRQMFLNNASGCLSSSDLGNNCRNKIAKKRYTDDCFYMNTVNDNNYRHHQSDSLCTKSKEVTTAVMQIEKTFAAGTTTTNSTVNYAAVLLIATESKVTTVFNNDETAGLNDVTIDSSIKNKITAINVLYDETIDNSSNNDIKIIESIKYSSNSNNCNELDYNYNNSSITEETKISSSLASEVKTISGVVAMPSPHHATTTLHNLLLFCIIAIIPLTAVTGCYYYLITTTTTDTMTIAPASAVSSIFYQDYYHYPQHNDTIAIATAAPLVQQRHNNNNTTGRNSQQQQCDSSLLLLSSSSLSPITGIIAYSADSNSTNLTECVCDNTSNADTDGDQDLRIGETVIIRNDATIVQPANNITTSCTNNSYFVESSISELRKTSAAVRLKQEKGGGVDASASNMGTTISSSNNKDCNKRSSTSREKKKQEGSSPDVRHTAEASTVLISLKKRFLFIIRNLFTAPSRTMQRVMTKFMSWFRKQ